VPDFEEATMPDSTSESRRRRRGGSGLGRTQRLVLRLLAAGEGYSTQGAKSARNLSYDWPGLTESAAYSAVMRLADRGLVDAAGWEHDGGRTYKLTAKGRGVEAELNRDEYDLEEPGE